MMDFLERLKDSINDYAKAPMHLTIGYLTAEESMAIAALPGGQISKEYYDEIKEQSLNYEIAIKTKDQALGNATLWQIQTYLEGLDDLKSSNQSFDFEKLNMTNKPYLSNADESGFFIYVLDFSAVLTTYK